MRQSTRPARRLRLEALEARDTPAGSITATQAGGVLTLTGDDHANVVRIRGDANPFVKLSTDVVVTGLSGTTINGVGSRTFLDVTSIKVALKDGDDVVTTDPNGEFEIFGPVTFNLATGTTPLPWPRTAGR